MTDGISISIVNMNAKRNMSVCNEPRRGLMVVRGWIVARVDGESLEPVAGRLTEQEAELLAIEINATERPCKPKAKRKKRCR